MADARERLIVALDVPNAPEARRIVATIGDSAQIYKVGKQLFTAEGPQIVRDLVASGRDVFLDLKYHDIPNTVAGAVRMAAQLGVRMLTVHASGGLRMLRAAVEAAATAPAATAFSPSSGAATRPLILAVTVLTSLNDEDLT
ncbi:MAG: orotidine 5'-phosphate decarboxylase / HUMPS family protein, partial [Terriglobales bacterium]